MDKQEIVKAIRQQREAYSVEERLPWDQAIHNYAINFLEPFEVIGLYCAFKGEVDTYGLMESLFWDEQKIIAVPKVEANGVMNFYRIRSFKDLKVGKMGILEPTTKEQVIPQVIMTPLSAFNSKGYRIGYGGGYYDRYFSKHECVRVGLAYSFQYLDLDFQESFDIPCEMILTERAVYYEEDHASV